MNKLSDEERQYIRAMLIHLGREINRLKGPASIQPLRGASDPAAVSLQDAEERREQRERLQRKYDELKEVLAGRAPWPAWCPKPSTN